MEQTVQTAQTVPFNLNQNSFFYFTSIAYLTKFFK